MCDAGGEFPGLVVFLRYLSLYLYSLTRAAWMEEGVCARACAGAL